MTFHISLLNVDVSCFFEHEFAFAPLKRGILAVHATRPVVSRNQRTVLGREVKLRWPLITDSSGTPMCRPASSADRGYCLGMKYRQDLVEIDPSRVPRRYY